jgi:hypothetical protein
MEKIRIRDGKNPDPGYGMNIPWILFLRTYISFLGKEYLNSLMRIRIRDLVNPVSPNLGSKIWDPGWKKSDH